MKAREGVGSIGLTPTATASSPKPNRFARSDADGNGEITKEEFRGAMKEWRKKHGKAE
jgi:hypothetical protein